MRRLAVIAATLVLGASLAATAEASVPDLRPGGAGALQAQLVADSVTTKAKPPRPRPFRKGVWIPVPAAPSLLLARVEITLKKPNVSAARAVSAKRAKRPQKPIVTLRDRALLPRGLGATGSLWRASPASRFVAALAFAIRANRSDASGERVFAEVRSRVPIRKLRVKWERFRAREAVRGDFGRCLFSLGERARTQHFVKRIGGRLPDAYTARDVARAVTAVNCGASRGDFLQEIGFTVLPSTTDR